MRRLLTALKILFLPGDHMPVTRQELLQMRADWEGWQTTFSQIIDKLNMAHAREQKAKRRALERATDELLGAPAPEPAPPESMSGKLALYRRATQLRIEGLSPLPSSVPGPHQNGDEEP